MAARDYAHLLSTAFSGSKAKKAAKPEDTTDEQEGEEQAPPANDKEDGKHGKKAAKKAKKAGEGDTDEEREDEDSEEGEGEESKETTDEDEEDEEEENLDKKRSRKAKKAERVRIGRILSSEAAQKNPQAAMKLALETSMPSSEAIAFLSINAGPAERPRRLAIDQRMETTRSPSVGLDADNAGRSATGKLSVEAMTTMTAGEKAALISAAGAMRRGEAGSIQEGLKKLG